MNKIHWGTDLAVGLEDKVRNVLHFGIYWKYWNILEIFSFHNLYRKYAYYCVCHVHNQLSAEHVCREYPNGRLKANKSIHI